jgi:hypothetical protein
MRMLRNAERRKSWKRSAGTFARVQADFQAFRKSTYVVAVVIENKGASGEASIPNFLSHEEPLPHLAVDGQRSALLVFGCTRRQRDLAVRKIDLRILKIGRR